MIKRRNPFEIVLLAFLIMSCIPQLIGGPKPDSVSAAMPGWWYTAWLLGTIVGSLVTLVGIFVRGIVNGVYLEWSGIPLVMASLTCLGAAQVLYAGPKAAMSAAIVSAMVIAFAIRRRELGKLIAALPKKE